MVRADSSNIEVAVAGRRRHRQAGSNRWQLPKSASWPMSSEAGRYRSAACGRGTEGCRDLRWHSYSRSARGEVSTHPVGVQSRAWARRPTPPGGGASRGRQSCSETTPITSIHFTTPPGTTHQPQQRPTRHDPPATTHQARPCGGSNRPHAGRSGRHATSAEADPRPPSPACSPSARLAATLRCQMARGAPVQQRRVTPERQPLRMAALGVHHAQSVQRWTLSYTGRVRPADRDAEILGPHDGRRPS